MKRSVDDWIKHYIDYIGEYVMDAYEEFMEEKGICEWNETLYQEFRIRIGYPSVREEIIRDLYKLIDEMEDNEDIYEDKFLPIVQALVSMHKMGYDYDIIEPFLNSLKIDVEFTDLDYSREIHAIDTLLSMAEL